MATLVQLLIYSTLFSLFGLGILYLLLRKPGWKPDGQGMMAHALIIPVSVVILLALAFLLMSLGSLGPEPTDSETLRFAGIEYSTRLLQTTSRNLGVGIVTGVVAGAIISVVNRWHDFEKQ